MAQDSSDDSPSISTTTNRGEHASFVTDLLDESGSRLRNHPSSPRTTTILAIQDAWNFPILPLRTRTRGPAYTLPLLPPGVSNLDVDPSSESYDCLDEIVSLFRANAFFRNFEIKGTADRMLIYGMLFISECLSKLRRTPSYATMSPREAEKSLTNIALEQFAIPGDVTFPLNQAFEAPRDRHDAEALRQYLSQVRQELAIRLHERLYPGGEGPSKWWLSFSRRKFMGLSL